MPFVLEYSGIPSVTSSEESFLSCLIDLFPTSSASTARRLRAKLYVDDVEKPIKSAQWSDNSGQGNLSIELANIADRSAFTRTALIKFQTEEYLAGVWTVIKTYCDGAILATSNYNIENNGNNPNDSFSITVLPLLQQRLDTTPEQTVVLYDPAKVTVNDEDLEVVPNVDGTEGTVTVTPIADMNLGDVLQFLADTLGFAGYKTNLNFEPWKLARVDFPAAQPYWNTVAGIIGNHEPKLSIDDDNYLVIRDGTLTDYISPRQMTLTNFKGVQLNKTIERFKGCFLTYQIKDDGWDYWVFNTRHPEQWFEGLVGQYPFISSEIWEQKFYKKSFPNTPVNVRTLKEYHHVYSGASTLVSATGEVFSYQNGQISRRDKREFALAKVPQSWATYNATLPGASAGFIASFGGAEELYSSSTDTTFVESLTLTKTERETFTYVAHPFEADSVYLSDHDHWVKGLITVDSENKQLGNDFEQPLARAQENGNLAEGQGSRWGTTDYQGESQRVLRNRKVMIRQRGNTPLNSQGLSYQDGEDVRVGDIGIQVIRPETRTIKITEGGDPTATLWRSVNGGEEPLVSLQPLCHRLNKRQDFPGEIQAPLPTYDETVSIGLVFDPKVDGRTSTSLGIFEVTGYTDTFNNLEEGGFATAITARQIG